MIYIGTVMEIDNLKKRALVFTMDGRVVYIRLRSGLFTGQQVSFTRQEVITGSKRLMKALTFTAAVAAALVLVIFGAQLLGKGLPFGTDTVCAGFVSVDINPSVELSINGNGVVIAASAKNEDGQRLLGRLKLSGLSTKAAVEAAIDEAKRLGYLSGSGDVVLVAASASGPANSQFRQRLQSMLQELDGSGDEVLALYIEDDNIKAKADENELSLGRELLREFASQRKVDIKDEDIKAGKIADILYKLNCQDPDELTNPDATAKPTEAATEKPTQAPTEAPTDKPTAEPTDKPTAKPTAKPTDKPTYKPTQKPQPTGFTGSVTVTAVEEGLRVTWDKAPSASGFCYYKVVFSKYQSAPKYPDDGYAAAISDINATSEWFGPYTCYNGGDVGGKLRPGEKYYVSVTYVYEHTKLYGSVQRATFPGSAEPTPTASEFTLTVTVKVNDNGTVTVKWTPLPSSSVMYDGCSYEGFKYYKVVASTHENPRYPDDGYIAVITQKSACQETFAFQNIRDKDGNAFYSGQTVHFSVTYVFDNGKIYGNDAAAVMP